MATEKPDRKPAPLQSDGWFPIALCCDVFNVNRPSFDITYRPLVPPEAIQKIGASGKVYIRIRDLIEALTQKRVKDALESMMKKAANGKGDDVLLAGEITPALEEYRRVKTEQAKITLEQMKGEYVPIAELREKLQPIFGNLRRAVETLQTRYGNDASQIIADAVADAAKAIASATDDKSKGK